MAKHPVPKKKTSNSRSKRRYSTFQSNARKKILSRINVVACSNCGEMKRSHTVCTECGQYRGRNVLQKGGKNDTIERIKA